jgi:hypothetical protein
MNILVPDSYRITWKLKNIRLYPGGRKLKLPGGFYEKYREAWHLLKDES